MSDEPPSVTLARWAACRCSCVRPPTGYCVCVVNSDGVLVGFRSGLETDYSKMGNRPVADDCDRVTAKDRRDGRK